MDLCHPPRPGRHRLRRPLAAAGIALLAAALCATLPGARPAQAMGREPLPAQAHAEAQAQAPGQAAAQDGVVDTEYGPLAPGDRDFLVRVRYASLWEIPAGELARERGSTGAIREIGGFIADEHVELDQELAAAAEQLGVALPDEPHADHQAFLDRLEGASGEEFDDRFVQLLREAHGVVYPLIAHVRAGTHNQLVRDFAKTAEEFVGRHLDYLESSGLVDWIHIPAPPEPGGARSRFLSTNPAGVNPVLIWALLGAATIAGTAAVVRTVRPR